MNRLALIAISWAALASPAFAHHSAAAIYDVDTVIPLNGTITSVEWMNPHVRFYVDVEDAEGNVANWEIETSGPAGFMRRGFRPDTLKIGDPITVSGYPARDGSPRAVATKIILADGTDMGGSPSAGK